MRPLLAIFLLTLPLHAAPEFGTEARPVLAKYCFSCHGEDKQEAGIELHVLFAKPEGDATAEDTARKILGFHGSLAFRRRLADDDLAPLVAPVTAAVEKGASFEDAMKTPLTALLVHPRFLFRLEHDQPDQSEWLLDDFELATRLSYFLWSSMPDSELFKLADEGKLRDPAVLRQQVQRMIADDKSRALSRHFAGQWLGFDELIDRAQPDQERFPEFTRSLRAAMYRESEHFFDHLLRENRPATELLDADYTFLNDELARHYGIAGVRGSEMRRVGLTDRNRGGVVGMASVLTVTSLPLRTSPVRRGKWILETMLGEPPPPPLPDAGELPADDQSAEGLSFRAQLEQHRKNPKCASCHARIDPLGFGLENFDAIGRWRTHEVNGQPVDSSAVLPGAITFSTPAELKQLLLQAKDKVARNLCRKMLAYALGRPLEYYDEPVLNELLAALEASDYRLQPLVLAIAQSFPFQNRSAHR